MCKKHTEDNEIEGNSSTDDNSECEDGMTREEFERKFRKHMERRREAYVKMGTVDEPRE